MEIYRDSNQIIAMILHIYLFCKISCTTGLFSEMEFDRSTLQCIVLIFFLRPRDGINVTRILSDQPLTWQRHMGRLLIHNNNHRRRQKKSMAV
jgi:hypothetical protein